MVIMIKFFKSRSAFSIIMMLLTAAYIGFIWFNSFQTADESASKSLALVDILNNFIKSLGLEQGVTDYMVRKSAHFCEFALLGFLCTWTGRLQNKRILKNLTTIGFVCLAAAVTDEFIQYYPAGRSAQVNDVVLDFTGAVTGLLIFLLIIGIIGLVKKIKR